MATKKRWEDYNTEGERKIALRIYVNRGERQIIKDAIDKTERIKDLSAWGSRLMLKTACDILGIDYPYDK